MMRANEWPFLKQLLHPVQREGGVAQMDFREFDGLVPSVNHLSDFWVSRQLFLCAGCRL